MNWIKENKFLSGFFAVMIVGVALFGFLLYSSSSNFSDVSEKFKTQADELKRLQSLQPYPNEENLQKTRAEKEAYVSAIVSLQKRLSAMQFPLEPMEPAAYQDVLRKTVSAAVDTANKNGVKLPDKFYEGLEVYQTAPPKDAAAATALGRELKAISLVVNTLLDNKVDEIKSISRTPLPEETETAPAKPAGGVKPGASKPLVVKHSFSVSFIAEQSRLRKALNEITASKDQFLIIRALRIRNQNEKGPSRVENTATAGLTAPAEGTATPTVPGQSGAPAADVLRFVVGTEKLQADATIETVDFAPPATK